MYQTWAEADGKTGDGYCFMHRRTFSLKLADQQTVHGASLIQEFPDWYTLQEREKEAYRADSESLCREIIAEWVDLITWRQNVLLLSLQG